MITELSGLMNLLIKNIAALFLSGLIFYSSAQDCKATIFIETDIEEPVILVNGIPVENSKTEIELKPGTYEITIKQPDNYWDGKIMQREVIITRCNHQDISFIFNEEIYLKTNPDDVRVYSMDELIGYTPLFITPQYKNLLLEKPGYESKLISLNDIRRSSPVKLDYIGKVKEESFFKKDLFKFLIGGIVVLGGTTAYFKLKADDKFEEYELSGDQRLLDETRRYDL
jgi:hypothetical protein